MLPTKEEDSKSEIKCNIALSDSFLVIPTKTEVDDKNLAIIQATSICDSNFQVKSEEIKFSIKKEDTQELCSPSSVWSKQDFKLLPLVKTESILKFENAFKLLQDEKKICIPSAAIDFSRIPVVEIMRIPEIEFAVKKYEEEKKVMLYGMSEADSKETDIETQKTVLHESTVDKATVSTLDVNGECKRCFIKLDIIEDNLLNTLSGAVSKDTCSNAYLLNKRTKWNSKKKETTSKSKQNVALVPAIDSRPFSCTFNGCLANFKKINHLKGHMKVHLKPMSYICSTCHKPFPTKQQIKSHLCVHSTIKNCICNDCGRSFFDKKALKMHSCIRKLHPKRYNCNKCDKSFTNSWYRATHERWHTNTKPFSCVDCGKSFIDKKFLKIHLLVHTGAKPYVCNFCDKSFSQRPHLNRHILLHTGVKPFSCTVCSKQFRDKSNLRVHMIYHSGTRPFKCDRCDKGFTQSSHLNSHKRTVHSESRPLSCNICGMRFKNRIVLQSHVWIHSDTKPHNCKVCNGSFSQYTQFKRHNCHGNRRKPKNKTI